MHSLRQDQVLRPLAASLKRAGSSPLLLLALLAWPPAPAQEEPPAPADPARKPAPPGERAPPAEAPARQAAPAGNKAPATAARKPRPPARVALPPAGIYPAEEILALGGLLTGRVVRIESDAGRQVKIEVSPSLEGMEVNLEELRLLLSAHRLYLFETRDPKEGDILVASRDQQWEKRLPRFIKVLQVNARDFDAVWQAIDRAVKEKNARQPRGGEAVVAVPSARAGKILVRAPTQEAVDDLARLAEKSQTSLKVEPEERIRLYTHLGRFRSAAKLLEDLRSRLSEGERNRLHAVISQRGNNLLFRAPQALGDKVAEMLKDLDRQQ